MSDITIADLFNIIGRKEVEITKLRQEVAEVRRENELLKLRAAESAAPKEG